MVVKIYEFPTLEDGLRAIEYKVVELTNKYRNGRLEPIEEDWLSYANTVLDYGVKN